MDKTEQNGFFGTLFFTPEKPDNSTMQHIKNLKFKCEATFRTNNSELSLPIATEPKCSFEEQNE